MTDELALDEKTIRFIESRISAMRTIESELNGALGLLLEQHELKGKWHLDLPGRRLVPVPASAPDTQLTKAA